MKKLLLSALVMTSFLSTKAQLWTPVDANIDTTIGIKYLSAVDTNTIWSVAYDGFNPQRAMNKFNRTTDGVTFTGGMFYADTNSYSPSNICAIDDTIAYISSYFKAGTGTPGQILRTIDGGTTWNNIASAAMYNGAANFPNMVHFWDANKGWTMGDPNGGKFEIWRTMDAGTNWTRVPLANIPAHLSGEYGTTDVYTTYGDHHIWFGTNKGRIFRSADTGATWQMTALTGMAGGVYGVAFRDSLHGMAWGAATTAATPVIAFRVTSNGGQTWTTLNTTTTGASIGWSSIDNIPGTNRYLSVGLNVPRSAYVTSVTADDGLTWDLLESGISNTERIIEVEALDSTHAWGGNFSDNTLPFGFGGMAKYGGPNMATIGLRPVAEVSNSYVYPNPSNGVVTLKLAKVMAGTSVKVVDLLGKEVFSTKYNSTSLNEELKINISENAKGIYLMQISNGNSSEVQKLIVE